jgi:hypothetical protein
LLSLLLGTNHAVTLRAPQSYKLLRSIKDIFMLEQLTIIDQEAVPNCIVGHSMSKKLVSDYCKFWSPYFDVDSIKVFEQSYTVGKTNKPCIGLATDQLWASELPHNGIPFNRLYTKEVWLQIIDLVVASGYDVITFNQNNVNLEQKIYMMNELCDCVIGYEGGLCHLAHVLKVPCIIMPWHHHESGADPEIDGSLFYVPQKMHLDRRTYFVKSKEEILSWTPLILKNQINALYSEQGNNVYFCSDYTIGQEHGITLIKNYTVKEANQAQLTEWEEQFIQTYITNFDVGGI